MIKYWFLLNNKCLPFKKTKLPHQGASLNAPPITPMLQRVMRSRTGLNVRLEFGIIWDYFCLPSTSPHINHHPSPSSLSLSLSLGVGFPLPSNSQNRRQIYAHPLVLMHTRTTAPWRAAFPLPLHTQSKMSAPIIGTVPYLLPEFLF